jgi:hypothetical protein
MPLDMLLAACGLTQQAIRMRTFLHDLAAIAAVFGQTKYFVGCGKTATESLIRTITTQR